MKKTDRKEFALTRKIQCPVGNMSREFGVNRGKGFEEKRGKVRRVQAKKEEKERAIEKPPDSRGEKGDKERRMTDLQRKKKTINLRRREKKNIGRVWGAEGAPRGDIKRGGVLLSLKKMWGRLRKTEVEALSFGGRTVNRSKKEGRNRR